VFIRGPFRVVQVVRLLPTAGSAVVAPAIVAARTRGRCLGSLGHVELVDGVE